MRITISILTLGLSVWALPALATPSHTTHAHGKSEASASQSARQVNVDLRIDTKHPGIFEPGNAVHPTRYHPGQDGRDWKSDWTRLNPRDSGTLVPEPSAMTLFGVGVLVALQAIPRRSSRAVSTGEAAGGATQLG